QRYREVLDLIQAGVWIHREGRIVFANDYAARMFGAHSPAELIGRDMMTLIDPADRPRAAERTRLMVSGEVDQVPLDEMRFECLDGRHILVEVQARRFLRDGKVHILASGRDVT